MTGIRILHVLAPDPDSVQAIVRAEQWGRGVSVVWVSDPDPKLALGLPQGTFLYEVRVTFRSALT